MRRPCNAQPSQVAANLAAVTILAANGSREGASVYNTADGILFLLMDDIGSESTVSSTVFSVALPALTGYFELPHNYQGKITGIWSLAGSGGAKITEFSV